MDRARVSFAFTVFVVCVFVATALADPRPLTARPKKVNGPTITFEEEAVIASGATPGSPVHFASLSLRGGDYAIAIEKPAGTVVADASGNARFTPPAAVRARSVWIVVDGGNGGFTVHCPPGMLLREIDLPGRGVHSGGGSTLRKIQLERHSIDFFLIRPGHGIWSARFWDGNEGDEDQAIDGKVDGDLSLLRAIDASGTPPDRVMPGDVLFLVDRYSLEFYAGKHGN